MKRFQFALESILALRLEKEQEAEMALGRAMGEWNRINGQKSRCLRMKEQYKFRPPALDDDLLQQGLFLAGIDQKIQGFDRELERREPELSSLRAAYREARSQREGLDKLREKREEEYRRDAGKQEARSMDDLLNNMDRIKAFRG